MSTTAELVFQKVHNFRDIGGLPTEDGRRMKSGLLYRSDELSRLSNHDLAKLEALGLKLICDLRTVNEQKSRPDRIPGHWNLKEVHIPIYHGSQDFTHFEFVKFLNTNPKTIDFADIIKDFYVCLVKERTGEIRKLFELTAEAENLPALIHCTGGKDRTGFISALFQLLAGVPQEIIVRQYLLSNERVGAKMKKTGNFIRLMSLYRIPLEKIQPMLAVDRKHLEYAFGYILDEYGSVEAYLHEGCGIKQESISKLKNMLVE
ncbi:tyrosine-protein phosphatase [Neobacillus notoginsengisoli]|uniref:Tyrosine-protein phosphatase n=1 Tax=Neobacillus notoginsengisoli TaxID=1578198 RepID=A0A417YXX3_9BACI|nr:tyrosine-protein phosphatase [Neobacillus notoginsengisoli]RHW42571.1 tyrosine-protein phosphatase [Neobacillus notoginsengisoli]